jgi:hypothetical protein
MKPDGQQDMFDKHVYVLSRPKRRIANSQTQCSDYFVGPKT